MADDRPEALLPATQAAEPARDSAIDQLVGHYIDDRIAAMRALLALMQPGSSAEALRTLRAAFPDASLSERVAAVQPPEA